MWHNLFAVLHLPSEVGITARKDLVFAVAEHLYEFALEFIVVAGC